ncbi:hypothetical protein JOC37_000162 [Desulfohalotomaculum tongense]|uniref:DUF1573 domain-containing protein n=1 Tax=Desulforadius tongensis TaxID=1216062 RepID=UPI001956BBA8|nr:DUF1573 domain-containing protein [Desulforadius tongensis]MBM7853797.1 hypothetical protein [Desulforadius tongensis]
MLKDLLTDEFQYTVSEQLICSRSILDILSKHQECGARINRSIVKTVTTCGCMKIETKKNTIPKDASLADLKNIMDSHLYGKLCPQCRETIEIEIGRAMVYLAALCNLLDVNLFDIIIKEHNKMKLLGHYNLT